MRVVFDGRTIQDHFPGIGRYSFNLAKGLAELGHGEAFVVLHQPGQRNSRYDLGELAARGARLGAAGADNFALAEQWRVPRTLRRLGAHVYHSPYLVMPYRPGCPAVVNIHDLIPLRYPGDYRARTRLLFRLTLRLAVGAAARIVTESQASTRDLAQGLGVAPRRLRTIPAAADPSFAPQPAEVVPAARARFGLPENYTLYVGSNKPHKNLARLARAYAGLGDLARRTPLVMAGHWDSRYPEVRQLVEAGGWQDRIRLLGPVPGAALPALYSGACAFLFPSLYEGFGLPVLEAMACGTPVACSRASSLPEVAGGAALLFDPLDEAAMADAARQLLTDDARREHLRSLGLAQAQTFSWERAAREVWAVYKEVATVRQRKASE